MPFCSLRPVVALAAAAFAATASTARAEVVFTVRETPTGIQLTGSGTLNIAGLSSVGNSPFGGFMNPATGSVISGPTAVCRIFLLPSGPTFGIGHQVSATTRSGDTLGISRFTTDLRLLVPTDYLSGSPLNTATFWSGATFSSLGITPGVYEWTWGIGATADRIVLDIPAPASLPLLAGAGVLATRRRRR